MKHLIFALALLLTSSCLPTTASTSGMTPAPALPTPVRITAVYLTQAPDQLSADDLRAHPEVQVVRSFDEFKQLVQTKVALWIDRNAVGLIPSPWLEEKPQRYYPLVLIGYNDTLYSFKYILGICCFGGPIVDWSTKTIEPGFSIMLRDTSDSPPFPNVVFLQGYNQTPQVKDILEITNALLEGRLKPTATPILHVASPTPVP
jgi:hypothetical protein